MIGYFGIRNQNNVIDQEVKNTIIAFEDRVRIGSTTTESLNNFLDRQNIRKGTYVIENNLHQIVSASGLEGYEPNKTYKIDALVPPEILALNNNSSLLYKYNLSTTMIKNIPFKIHYYKAKIEIHYKILIYIFAMFLIFLLLLKMNHLVKDLKQSNEKLNYLATTDPMTKLYNRRYFIEMAEQFLKIMHRNKQKISVALLDIDKFKNINDTYGHQAGDKVIIHFAEALQGLVRKSDILCRFGGEEFIILLPHTALRGAVSLSEKIREEIGKLNIPVSDKKILNVTVSIGVSEVEYNDKDINDAIARADVALYGAKNSGRNRVMSKKISLFKFVS